MTASAECRAAEARRALTRVAGAQYLWVDSEENQERFKDEYEKARAAQRGSFQDAAAGVASWGGLSRGPRPAQVLSYVSTHRDFLNSDKADQNGA